MTNVSAFIEAAWPRHATKQISRDVGCSDRQAQRIVSTGKIPGSIRAKLLAIIDERIAKNRQELERLSAELRTLEYEGMVARATDRRATMVGQVARLDQGSDEGPTLPLLEGRK